MTGKIHVTGIHESIFKVLFLDVGLLHAISGIYTDTAKEKDFTAISKGAVAEQFAGQELIVCHLTFHAFVIEVKIIMFISIQKIYYANHHGYHKRVKD